MSKTIFLDIDGVIFEHLGNLHVQITHDLKLLNGVLEKFHEWDLEGYRIILITGRRESARKITEKQLSNAGIFYDKLIMGLGRGDRIIINDTKPDSDRPTAFAFSPIRNNGIKDIKI